MLTSVLIKGKAKVILNNHVDVGRKVVRMAKGGAFGFGRGVLPRSFVRCYSRRTLHLVSAGTRTAKSRYFNRVVLGLGNRTTAAWPWLHRQLSVSAVCASVPGKHARSEVWDPEPQEGTTSGSLESWPGLDISIGSDVPEVADVVSQGGEVVAAGLGCYTPVGLVQQSLEFLHVNAHMPWWVAIVTATVALRVAMLPVAIMMQRNAANLANLQPQLEVIQRRMLLYKEAGNPDAVAREVADLMKLYQKHNARPMRLFLMPFLQMPIFITFFVALRKMAQAPVVSMQSGGTLWFTDLTIPDPFFALPLLACGAFLSNIEVRLSVLRDINP